MVLSTVLFSFLWNHWQEIKSTTHGLHVFKKVIINIMYNIKLQNILSQQENNLADLKITEQLLAVQSEKLNKYILY